MEMGTFSANANVILLRLVGIEDMARAVQIANDVDYQLQANNHGRIAQIAIRAKLLLQLSQLCRAVVILLHRSVVASLRAGKV